jgi:putative flavoprotein involved in K+ transport
LPLLEDDRVLDVANVIWCTGFHPSGEWSPARRACTSLACIFLSSMTSETVTGVGRDAAHVAEAIASRPGLESEDQRPGRTRVSL